MGTLFRDISRYLRIPANRAAAHKKLRDYYSKERTFDELVDTAMNMGTKGHFRINSMQVRSEILSLVKRVDEIKPERILEIGTCNGGTLFLWSNLASKQVITCDLIIHKHRNELYKKFTPPNSSCLLTTLEGDSHQPSFKERVAKELNGNKVDFLFIDGDHSEEGAEADYNDYKEFVRPGGLIGFHDIVKNQPVEGNRVFYFWERIKNTVQTEEFVSDPNQCGYGIGVIQVEE